MEIQSLKASLIQHEGDKDLPYKDSNNHLTIGIGHNLDQPMPEKLRQLILDYDIGVALDELDRAFPDWREHSVARQNVLIEMMFNLGAPTFEQFVRFWAAMRNKDYDTASTELLSSRWAQQVHGRAVTLARRIREDTLV